MEYLAITVLGENKTGIANELTKIASLSKANIIECKINSFGQEFLANLLTSGNWNSIAKLESNLESLEKKQGLLISKKRTKVLPYPKDLIPYIVYVVAKDQHSVLYKVTSFFADQHIDITELDQETRPARKTGAQIMSLTMFINVPVEMNIADLRERFIVFCDSYNLDGAMEAEKGI